jgi:hypothetical protein
MTRRLPVSSRHAFALAFDLAVRRDWLHSIVVPLALQVPWVVLPLFLPSLPSLHGSPVRMVTVVMLQAVALLGLWLTGLLISAMLRFRAKSVFHGSSDSPIASPSECYARGLRTVPALFTSEVLRAASVVVGGFLFFFPGLYLGFKFSMATESVVLMHDRPRWRDEMRALLLVLMLPIIAIPLLTLVPFLMVPERLWIVWTSVAVLEAAVVLFERDALFGLLLGDAALPALRRSFRLTEGRWERWLEMIAISVMIVVPIWFLMTVGALVTPSSAWNIWFSLGTWLTQAVLLAIQYAWTFFYLRLEDSVAAGEAGANVVVPPGGAQAAWRAANAPKLRLVESPRPDEASPDA